MVERRSPQSDHDPAAQLTWLCVSFLWGLWYQVLSDVLWFCKGSGHPITHTCASQFSGEHLLLPAQSPVCSGSKPARDHFILVFPRRKNALQGRVKIVLISSYGDAQLQPGMPLLPKEKSSRRAATPPPCRGGHGTEAHQLTPSAISWAQKVSSEEILTSCSDLSFQLRNGSETAWGAPDWDTGQCRGARYRLQSSETVFYSHRPHKPHCQGCCYFKPLREHSQFERCIIVI